MKRLLLLFIGALLLVNGCSTRMVFTPDGNSITNPKVGFLSNQEIDLVIYDGRLKKEYSDELRRNIADYIKITFPSAKINALPEKDYYTDSKPNRITLKIGIANYVAGFGSNVSGFIGSFGGTFYYGMIPNSHWNGLVGLSVNIFDYRNGNNKKTTKNIGKIASQPNTFGYATAKEVLSDAYQAAMMELASLIESALLT